MPIRWPVRVATIFSSSFETYPSIPAIAGAAVPDLLEFYLSRCLV